MNHTKTIGWKRWLLSAGLVSLSLLLVTACANASAESVATLRQSLEPGHGPDYYWQEIEGLGYEVTSVNYDRPDYVEYEIVKDGETYEVQLQLDDERIAREIEIDANTWRADETAAAVEESVDMVTIPAGTRVQVEIVEAVSSATASVGQRVDFRVAEGVVIGDTVAIPQGAAFEGQVVLAEKAERPQKPGKLQIDVDQLSVRGTEKRIDASFAAKGKGSHEEDARDVGIGAVLGAVVGAIAGGKDGAIAGIVLGGGGVFLATKGEDVEFPAGTRLVLELDEAVDVPRGS